MVPPDLHDFLIACLTASASFIGLLFVGLSVVLQRVETDHKLADMDRLLAESSFAGLVDIFFVSLVGLIPNTSIGYVSLIMALLGLLSCWRLLRLSRPAPLITSALFYLLQAGFGLVIIVHHNSRPLNIGVFQAIIIGLFAISLIRAWGLTGIHEGQPKKKARD